MKHLLYILIGISSLSACTSSPDSYYPRYSGFPKTEALSAQVISLDTILLRYPFRVTVRDSIAIVMDLHNVDHYLGSAELIRHSKLQHRQISVIREVFSKYFPDFLIN